MKTKALGNNRINLAKGTLLLICVLILMAPHTGSTREPLGIPDPVVAIHVSENTQALESMVATPPTPTGSGWSGYEWFYTSWHYSVAYDSLKEALSSAGIPFVVVTDANIIAGNLLRADGTPRYPILFSLNTEAIDDAEVDPLRDYVDAGGFLFVGASAFTRNLNGTTRTEFALATEMGMSTVYSDLMNWVTNTQFTKSTDHRLVTGIPAGSLGWRMPLTAEQIPWGVSPGHSGHWSHYIFTTQVTTATLIAQGSSYPLLTTRQYGQGNFIYYSPINPLIGYGAFDPSMYSYLIFRNAIDWAFESAGLPVISLSPWRYQYDAAFVIRHDFENYQDRIRDIKNSAIFENSHGAKGDYYFCTGTLRDEMADKATVIADIQTAVSTYGATIGSHNGGLLNPVNGSLIVSDYDYWHWGPDEALDTSPSGYPNGRTYAKTSITSSYTDIEGWLAGLDNGRAGCGVAANCPRIWASPYFNSTREDSHAILNELSVITAGEQRISPFPSWTISTVTPGGRYPQLTLPPSEWFASSTVSQALEDHTSETMRAAVDFYYNLGALINIYHHKSSTATALTQEYVTYPMAKPRIWATNSVGVYDWWVARSVVTITPSFSTSGGLNVAQVTIAGATDSNTAVDLEMAGWSSGTGSLQVLLNGSPADPADYRVTSKGIKVKVGSTVTTLEVRYSPVKINSVSLNPATVIGGVSSEGTVTLSAAAPAGGVVVALSSGNPAVATVPANVTITEGNTSGTFTITTVPVSSSTPSTISAEFAGETKTADLTVTPVEVTVQTSPAGRSYTVDGNPYSSTQTFYWSRGSTHTIATTSPQSGGAGTQYLWSSWSDTGAMSHDVTPTANVTYTANFTTQYYLTMNAGTGGSVTPPTGWFNSGQSVQIQATAAGGYAFTTWTGTGTGSYSGTDNPVNVTMNAPISETAAFKEIVQVTVQTNPAGRSFSVDGTPYTSAQSFTWDRGSNHTIATTTPQGDASTQHVWNNWSDTGALSHSVAPTGDTTYTANFTTQHYLTMNGGTGGSVTPPSGWFNNGQTVQIQATTDSGYSFGGWTGSGSGSYTGSNNPVDITMNGPITETASFAEVVHVTVQTNPAGRSFSVDGTPYTSAQAFTWPRGSSHTIATTAPQSVDAGSQYAWSGWSDGGALSHSISPTVDTTYTAGFTLQYYLTMSAGTGGSVTPPSGWHDSGQTVQIQATAASGYAFTTWTGSGTGSYSGTSNPVNVTMNAAITESAAFKEVVQVTVQTNPAGRSFSVDGTPYTSAQSFTWDRGSEHTIATTTPQGDASTQYLWNNWSDTGALSHSVAPTADTTYTANFTTQHYLTMSAGTGGSATPPSGWYNSGQSVEIQATANSGYAFNGWTGAGTGSYSGTNNPVSITMNAPITEAAAFKEVIQVTIQTSPAGRSFSVDGAPYTSAQTFTWDRGSSHTIATTAPQSGDPGIQYLWGGWSDSGALSHSVAPIVDTTYTASFNTQYYLVMNAGAGGSVTPPNGWYDSGQTVQIQANADSNYAFTGWTGAGTGSYTGTSNPVNVTMNSPVTQTAAFTPTVQVTVQATPAGRSFSVDGNPYTSPQTFTWNSGSSHTIATTSPQSGDAGVQYVFSGWSDSGAISHTVSPTVDTTYTADFTTQYYLTTSAGSGGSVTPPSGWHDSGQSVQIQATADSGYAFTTWTGTGSGSYSGSTNPVNVTMNGPITENAAFKAIVQVTVQTNPAGLSITVDSVPYASPQTFTWDNGSSHTIATTSPQSGAAGVQYVWSNWSDTGALSHDVAPTSNTTYTANFTTQYYLTMSAGTGGGVTPPSGWFDSGQTVQIQANADSGYVFTGWTGVGSGSYSGVGNPVNVVMNNPMSESASFATTVQVIVQTSPAGRSYTVDGSTYSWAQAFIWVSGSSHTIATTSPQSAEAGAQYVWTSWNDGGNMSHSVAPTTNTTYTANFTKQYYLTMNAGVGGGVSPASGWFDSGQSVQIQATPNLGYGFTGWTGSGTGSYTGTNNPRTITMNAPITESAGFASAVQITVRTNPAGRTFNVDGTDYSAQQTFTWIPGSDHTIATASPQAWGAGTQYVWTSWSDSGAMSHGVAPMTDTTYTAHFLAPNLALNFGVDKGLYRFNGASWAALSSWVPDSVIEWSGGLAVDFGVAHGLYTYDGTSWKYLTGWDAQSMVKFGNNFVVDFGAGRGLFQYNGTSWTLLSSWVPEKLVEWSGGLAVDFGPGRGLYIYNGSLWIPVSQWDPQDLAKWGDNLVVNFGTGRGLFVYTGTSWIMLTGWVPESVLEWAGGLAVDFGAARGLFNYNGSSWTHLSIWDPQSLAKWGNNLMVNFGAGRGLFQYTGTAWLMLTGWIPDSVVEWSGGLAVDFGSGRGLFNYNGTFWTLYTGWDPAAMIASNLK